jgi:2-polyprenyl-3-methyl-5-hydroxy-6-metoxy-1,4-benzoquinol methylase
MPGTAYRLARAWNSARKLAAGLTPHGESVWPGVRNDLFVAHASIYSFFSGFVAGKRVLDAACGTGYGSDALAVAGAVSVVGVDLDPRSLRYARCHFGRPNLEFRLADCERLEFAADSFDLIVSSNTLEHLHNPELFLAGAHRLLSAGGGLVVAVPPITDQQSLAEHYGIRYHRSNLSIDAWLTLCEATGWGAEAYRHVVREGVTLDFTSPFESKVRPEDFEFPKSDRDGLYDWPTITAVFVLSAGAA